MTGTQKEEGEEDEENEEERFIRFLSEQLVPRKHIRVITHRIASIAAKTAASERASDFFLLTPQLQREKSRPGIITLL